MLARLDQFTDLAPADKVFWLKRILAIADAAKADNEMILTVLEAAKAESSLLDLTHFSYGLTSY